MFDRTACPDAELLAARSFVSITALAALSVLLDLALKDRTPSAALLSGAPRASHDQNRGETHVTQERNAKEGIPTQSTTAAADGPVRDRSGDPANGAIGAPAWSELPAEARAALTNLMTQLILNHAAPTATPPAKEVSHDL